MGSGASKSGYDWRASSPPTVSLDVLESLQASPETDASRARLMEQQIQARVAQELDTLLRRESQVLGKARDAIASVPDTARQSKSPSRQALTQEVENLRRKLEDRKQVRDLPESCRRARSDLVVCLREKDRRPLDCWQEVERFKAEVQKLEKDWVDEVIR